MKGIRLCRVEFPEHERFSVAVDVLGLDEGATVCDLVGDPEAFICDLHAVRLRIGGSECCEYFCHGIASLRGGSVRSDHKFYVCEYYITRKLSMALDERNLDFVWSRCVRPR